MELWDAYDKDFNLIPGITLKRDEADSIPDGVYHLVCHILVEHTDGTFLLMQRDICKTYPGMWEATAGGSALKGETAMEAAFRELREETGIVAESLKEIKRIVDGKKHSVYVFYLCVTGCDKDSVVLQEGETIAYRWLGKSDIVVMGDDELLSESMRDYISKLA